MKIIDVSYHNGHIDFDKVKKDGIDGVILRAGYGKGSIDPMFNKYISDCMAVGLHIGIYWFSYAYTIQMAKIEGLACIKAIDQYRKYIDLPVFFDWEYDSMKNAQKNGSNPDRRLITDMIAAFAGVIRNAGYAPGYYLNMDYAKNYVDESRLKSFKRWLARYTDKSQTDCYLWQYTSKGQVNGISGNVDMDTLNGSLILKKDEDIVAEVLKGFWGNGKERETRLTNAGYDYQRIQNIINKMMQ